MEEFKEIQDFPNYQISNYGNVFSKNRNKILSPCDDSHGYLMVHLWKNNRQYVKKIHRLVAETFLENPNNFQDVNHKDENKKNNNISNLEWISRKDNLNYGTRNQRANATRKKPVYQIDKDTLDIINKFDSAKDASKQTGINSSNITQVCKHSRKTAGNYIWKFVEEEY